MQELNDINMRDWPIDVEDKEMPVMLEELQSELSRYFHMDKHLNAFKLIKHFEELVGKDLITNDDGDTLLADSEEVKKFQNSDLYLQTLRTEGLRINFLTCLTSAESGEDGWIKYYNEPTRRMFYKYTEGDPIIDVVTDCIIDFPMSKVLCSMAEKECMEEFTPELEGISYQKRKSDYNACMRADFIFPWPMYKRDL